MTDILQSPVEAPDDSPGPESLDRPEQDLSVAQGGVSVAIPDGLAPPEARQIAIIGYTNSRFEAPWDDPAFERWICNDLHKYVPDKWDRLYDLHTDKEIESDPDHLVFLQKCRRPVFVWNTRPEWPSAVVFPKEAATEAFGRYFTNSISWMTAHAIMEISVAADAWAQQQADALLAANPGLEALRGVMVGAARMDFLGRSAIHIYGVDMAQGTEYAAQRPSCEYFLGVARGMGIQTFIPLSSDLLKNISLYGAEDDTAFRTKLLSREVELSQRLNELQGQLQQISAHINQCQGALEDCRYWKGVWLNPHANRDGSAKGAEATQSDGAGQVIDLVEAKVP